MKCDTAIINRIKRTHGQMTGVLNLINEEATCEEIIMQLKAIKSSIEKTIGLITTTNLLQKIEEKNDLKIENVDEALALLLKSI
ncbi:metal-sensing transcriptional repressor [Acholeplasma hippikon]|uniref:Uncharacterized BCR, COG1937 n=1 Tax=Acholeplasma hippikon TaxID=264636 RepID=A0A449BI84_9MOLU|nr:metal-sensing transcriptional repressor [Acholeplasma hippikon]VEU82150.1 Uncharacterised BCR, COG1937 [Acholeplasma hippikon]